MKLADLLPEPLVAGTPAGTLTEEGAKLLDPTGTLQPGITFAPPEGDAGTGMVATTPYACAPATFPPAPPSSPWLYSNASWNACTRKWTSSPLRQAISQA